MYLQAAVIPTTVQIKRMRLTILRQYWEPENGLDSTFFSHLFGCSTRAITAYMKEIKRLENSISE